MSERENRDAVAFLVSLPERAERHLRIQVTMPTGLVREIDERTDNRSKFLTDAARSALRPMMKLRSERVSTKKAKPRRAKKGAHRRRGQA